VRILLGRGGVSPNKPDKFSETPHSRAYERGHMGVVALLQPLPSTTLSSPSNPAV